MAKSNPARTKARKSSGAPTPVGLHASGPVASVLEPRADARSAPTGLLYLLVALAASALVFFILELWRADLSIPLAYEWRDPHSATSTLDPLGSGDTLFFSTMTKGMVENGWFLRNRFIGAPTGLDLQDYSFGDNLHFLVMKVISLFTGQYGVIFNLFFLLTFPLAAISALFALLQLGISRPVAFVVSLIFSVLPYHFLRGEQHIFLAAYYIIPLNMLLAIWVAEDEAFFVPASRAPWWKRFTKSGWIAFVICFLTGAAGVYYALFGAFLVLVGGVVPLQRRKTALSLAPAILFSCAIVLFQVVNLLPTIAYHFQHGPNPLATFRLPAEAETHGLKIMQLLIPICGHRIGFLSDFAIRYAHDAPLVAENSTASLGVIASAGFLILLGRKLGLRWQTPRASLFSSLGTLNLWALLGGTIGGFGSIFAFVVSPILRCYNRMSIFIAFLSLTAVALLLDAGYRRLKERGAHSVLIVSFAAGLVLLAVFDQTSEFFVPLYAENAASFRNDGDFVSRIEQSVPPGSMIFQLPYDPFPAGFSVGDYQNFRGYLHSHDLRWSYGSMKGRQADTWVRSVLSIGDLSRIVQTLVDEGFRGIYVDKAYLPQAEPLETALRKSVDATPLVSANNRLLFFDFSRIPPAR